MEEKEHDGCVSLVRQGEAYVGSGREGEGMWIDRVMGWTTKRQEIDGDIIFLLLYYLY